MDLERSPKRRRLQRRQQGHHEGKLRERNIPGLEKQKTDDGDGLPMPRTLFSEEDELMTSGMMRELKRTRAEGAGAQPAASPQQPATGADAPQWLTHTECMLEK